MKNQLVLTLCFNFIFVVTLISQVPAISSSPDNRYKLDFLTGSGHYNYLVSIDNRNDLVVDSLLAIDGVVKVIDYYTPSLDTIACIYRHTYPYSGEGFFYIMYAYDRSNQRYICTPPIELIKYDLRYSYANRLDTFIVDGKQIGIERSYVNPRNRKDFYLINSYTVGYLQYDDRKEKHISKTADMRFNVKDGYKLYVD